MNQSPYYSEYDGSPVDDPTSLDYKVVDTCDSCNKRHLGTMYHAAGATGRVCPVLFICDECSAARAR